MADAYFAQQKLSLQGEDESGMNSVVVAEIPPAPGPSHRPSVEWRTAFLARFTNMREVRVFLCREPWCIERAEPSSPSRRSIHKLRSLAQSTPSRRRISLCRLPQTSLLGTAISTGARGAKVAVQASKQKPRQRRQRARSERGTTRSSPAQRRVLPRPRVRQVQVGCRPTEPTWTSPMKSDLMARQQCPMQRR